MEASLHPTVDELINTWSAMTCSHEAQKGITRFYLYAVSATGESESKNMLIPIDVDNKKPLR